MRKQLRSSPAASGSRKARALLGRAVRGEQLGVACVGRLAAKREMPERAAPQRFGHQAERNEALPRTSLGGRQVRRPPPARLHFGAAGGQGVIQRVPVAGQEQGLERLQALDDKAANRRKTLGQFGRDLEIHGAATGS
jgi:hypothetical protein